MYNTRDKNTQSETILKYLTFSLGIEEYGIPVLQVLEIIKINKLIEVPHAKKYFLGLMDVRGHVVPVIDLKTKLGIFYSEDEDLDEAGKHEDEEDEFGDRAIIIKAFGKRVGLAVDKVSHVHNFNTNSIDVGPASMKNASSRYITGVGKIKDNFVILLDLENLFTEGEILNLL